jgi:hypothetical protein
MLQICQEFQDSRITRDQKRACDKNLSGSPELRGGVLRRLPFSAYAV